MTLNNVPNANQTLGNSQPLINSNFVTIDTAFAIDHVPYDLTNSDNQGQHNRVSLPVQPSNPSFDAGTNGLYNLLYANTGKNEVFVHKQTASTTNEVPFTASYLSISNPPGFPIAQVVWTYLASGIILMSGFGAGTSTPSGPGLVNVPVSLPISWTTFFTVVPSIFTNTPSNPQATISLVGVSGQSFSVWIAGSAAPFTWIALAY